MSNQITDPEILLELKIKFEECDIVSYTYSSQRSMCTYWDLVIETNGIHYISEVIDNGEECCTDFESIDWYVAKLITIEKWVIQ